MKKLFPNSAQTRRTPHYLPGRLAYLRGVKAVEELTPEKIILVSGKNTVVCEGENLLAREYFQGDMVIKGNVKKVSVE